MTQEELQLAWADLSERVARLERLNGVDPQPDPNRLTSLDRLRLRYRRFAIIAALFAPVSLCYTLADIFPPQWRLWLGLYMALYFVTASVMDGWLCRRIGEIDVCRMPVAEIYRRTRLCRRRHHQFMAVLIPLAVVFVGLMTYAFAPEPYVIAGIIVGALTGAAIGLREYLRFMADYKNLH